MTTKEEREIAKEFKPHFLDDMKEQEEIIEEIPWINVPQINQNISIEL